MSGCSFIANSDVDILQIFEGLHMDLTWRQDLSDLVERVAVLGPRGLEFETSLLPDQIVQVKASDGFLFPQVAVTPAFQSNAERTHFVGVLVKPPDQNALLAKMVGLITLEYQLNLRLFSPRSLDRAQIEDIDTHRIDYSLRRRLGRVYCGCFHSISPLILSA
jgi:hypothetical protein